MQTAAPLPPLTIKQHGQVKRASKVIEEEAAKLVRKYRGLVDEDDLKSEGKLALYQSVYRFDEQRGPELEAYARRRVRGAMLRLVKCETRAAKLTREMQRASAERMADYTDDFDIMRHKVEEAQRRLDLIAERHASAMFLAGASEAKRQATDDPAAAAEYAETIAALDAVLESIQDEDRTLLDLIFASNFNLEEAAEELGVVKETAWRRIQRLLEKLRRSLIALGITRAPEPMVHPTVRRLLVPRAPPKPNADDEGTTDREERDGRGTKAGPGQQR